MTHALEQEGDLLITGAAIIDGVSDRAIQGRTIRISGDRIKAVAEQEKIPASGNVRIIDARGKYVIPGLMDGNVHLVMLLRLEDLVRYESRYEDLIIEAAQIALRNGITTVFDTWGPRQPLISVRDRINRGEVTGSRIYCGGNIIGLDGPLSPDFSPKAMEVASAALIKHINSMWAENVGPALTWMTPDQVADQVRAYIGKGVDFIKYAASEHTVPMGPTAFLAFSPASQVAIVQEAHRAGLIAQAHCSSVEALRVAIEAGADLIQHANISGPTPIPESTLRLLGERPTACTLFPLTRRRQEWLKTTGDVLLTRIFSEVTVATNVQSLVQSDATLTLATDATVLPADMATDPLLAAAVSGPDNLFELGQGHFHWLKAMEESGLAPMKMLQAATRNVARAYGKENDLGTLQPGKIADMIILDKNPLESAENYRCIHKVLKRGVIIDREQLPQQPVLSRCIAAGISDAR